MMLNERLWKLIAHMLTGEASPDELEELEERRRENYQVNYYIGILSAWWNLAEREGPEEAEQVFEKLLQQLEATERNHAIATRNLVQRKQRTSLHGGMETNTVQAVINFSMFRNYFKAAWRNFQKQKAFTFISRIRK